MDLAPEQKLHGFTVRTREELPEIDGTAYVLDHDKSGAQLLYLRNDDNNKAFSIAFKTPPADDTGVFHILEHSVLCGSDKFPVKEPFVDLLKSSMQTFLNAMTFPDKTMYPVARPSTVNAPSSNRRAGTTSWAATRKPKRATPWQATPWPPRKPPTGLRASC